MNQLTPKQQEWINRFYQQTGEYVSIVNLGYFTDGVISWNKFMEIEIESYRNWQNIVMKRIQGLWEE